MITEGSLQDFSLPDLLQISSMGHATGTLTLRSEGRVGQLFFKDGKLLAVKHGEREGLAAGAELFIWQSGVFDFSEQLLAHAASQEINLDELTHQGVQQMERRAAFGRQLPEFFSPRAWIYPMQMYAESVPEAVKGLGSGASFSDLVKRQGGSELDVLEEIVKLYKADQIGISSSPEEQLRQLFGRVAGELFTQFASISGVKMVDGLETQLNDQARSRHLSLRWRSGKLADSLPDGWSKEQLLAAYRPLIATMQEFIGKVYGAPFIERVVGPLLEEVPASQRPLWLELTSLPTPS